MTLLITDGFPRDLGLVEIDQRDVGSPLPPGVQRLFIEHTYTCSHCQRVVFRNPQRTRERYKCNGCNHHICDECAAKRWAGEPCRTWAQVIDEVANREARHPDAPSIILP